MDTALKTLNALFAQLGLPDDDAGMQRFIAEHRLSPETQLPDAQFWSPSQATFLREALEDDSDWAEISDQLNTLLR